MVYTAAVTAVLYVLRLVYFFNVFVHSESVEIPYFFCFLVRKVKKRKSDTTATAAVHRSTTPTAALACCPVLVRTKFCTMHIICMYVDIYIYEAVLLCTYHTAGTAGAIQYSEL